MSCGAPCPCQLSCMTDTQGSKRDPINSEKAWLDFAVRCLSRETVCKGKGQEAVWSSKCKPSWWDSVVPSPWKNPTANPKDTKEVLMTKYEALKQHLEADGRFPQELEEEANLWAEGKYKELFLLTSLSSLKGKVTGLHASAIETCTKADEMKAEVNQVLIEDIKSCLSATLKCIENLSTRSKVKNLKRPPTKTGKENEDCIVSKKRKLVDDKRNPKPLPVSKLIPILPKENNPRTVIPPEQSKLILAQLQKILIKRKNAPPMTEKPKTGHSTFPKKGLPHGTERSESEKDDHAPAAQTVNNRPNISSHICSQFTVSPNIHLNDSKDGNMLCQTNLENISIFPESAIITKPPSETNMSELSCYVKNSEQSSQQGSYFQNSEICNVIDPSDPKENFWTFIENIKGRDTTKSPDICEKNLLSNDSLCHDIGVGSRVEPGRILSENSHKSFESDHMDSGCISDASLDIDSILSPEELNRIWSDDDIQIDTSLDLWDLV